MARKPIEDRFWDKVKKRGDDECWLWTGSRYTHCRTHEPTYGMILLNKRRRTGAHRFSWELHHGPIPAGMDVLHKCDNPPCVNPAHLFLGTHVENMKDRDSKGRHSWGETRGTAHPLAKLTDAKVAELLQLHMQGYTHAALANRYQVSPSSIYAVLVGRTWKHVPRPNGLKVA